MAKTRQHLTPAEAAERGLLCKKDLKALGLMPGPATRPAGTVWQGRGAYYVYAPAECGPYVRQPNQALLRRREAASVAAEWLAGETVILDTETTGLYDAEIVELSIIDTAGNVLLDTLVRPTRPIPAEATEIHGITDEMVANAPTWAEVYPQYQALVAGKTIAAYNAEFDAGMVDKSCRAHGIEQPSTKALRPAGNWSCAMRLYSRWVGETRDDGQFRWHKLTAAAAACGVQETGAHRALADARMTLGVLQYLSERSSGRKT